MFNEELELDFEAFEFSDFHRLLVRTEEKDVTLKDEENWFEENDADRRYQVL